jgi:hypothetical protein
MKYLSDLSVSSIRAWAVFSYKNRDIFLWSMAFTRREAIAKIVENYSEPWVSLKAEGYAVEKISITPLAVVEP